MVQCEGIVSLAMPCYYYCYFFFESVNIFFVCLFLGVIVITLFWTLRKSKGATELPYDSAHEFASIQNCHEKIKIVDNQELHRISHEKNVN